MRNGWGVSGVDERQRGVLFAPAVFFLDLLKHGFDGTAAFFLRSVAELFIAELLTHGIAELILGIVGEAFIFFPFFLAGAAGKGATPTARGRGGGSALGNGRARRDARCGPDTRGLSCSVVRSRLAPNESVGRRRDEDHGHHGDRQQNGARGPRKNPDGVFAWHGDSLGGDDRSTRVAEACSGPSRPSDSFVEQLNLVAFDDRSVSVDRDVEPAIHVPEVVVERAHKIKIPLARGGVDVGRRAADDR